MSSLEWTPYATAVRALHLSQQGVRMVSRQDQTAFLLQHYIVLWVRPEFHLRNNHRTTIEFSRFVMALACGSERLAGRHIRSFIRHALNGLLPDGFTAEGSYSYASILHKETVAILVLLDRGHGSFSAGDELRSIVHRLDRALEQGRYRHGGHPGFGDTFPLDQTLNVAAELPAGRQAGRALFLQERGLEVAVSLGSQGGLGFGGHGHLDAGSFELSIDGCLVVADPGCSTYAPSLARTWERSALSHNMITPDWPLADQSTWGSFAYASAVSARVEKSSSTAVTITVDSWDRTRLKNVRLRRAVEIGQDQVRISDTLLSASCEGDFVLTLLVADRAEVQADWSVLPVRRRDLSAGRENRLDRRGVGRSGWKRIHLRSPMVVGATLTTRIRFAPETCR